MASKKLNSFKRHSQKPLHAIFSLPCSDLSTFCGRKNSIFQHTLVLNSEYSESGKDSFGLLRVISCCCRSTEGIDGRKGGEIPGDIRNFDMAGLTAPAVHCASGRRRPEPSPEYPLPKKGNGPAGLFVSKPSWIVRTESNVHKATIKRENPACVSCRGTGRIDCHHCYGRGRTNCSQLAMLPKGEWPEWCKTCRGSGLEHCRRCLGTGQYRDIMGFHFMKISNNNN